MKVVINTSYGAISSESERRRFDAHFIELVETGRFVGQVNEFGGYAETLKVVEIPDCATDYKIVEYDGCEGIFFVVNGKLYYTGSGEFSTRCIK